MDVFWVIPVIIVASLGLVGFLAYLHKHSSFHNEPRVLVDKPLEKPLIDPAAENLDWSNRPSGSFLKWHSGGAQ